MRLVAYNKKDLGYRGYKKTKNQVIIDEFIESGLDCAKLEGWTNKDAGSCATSINISIKRFKKTGIRCISMKGEVYLIREE